jgi:hypothetical protein
MQNKINHYLNFVYTQQKKLVEDCFVLSPWKGKRAIDLPPLPSEKLMSWYQLIRKNGYNGINIGLTSFWNKDNSIILQVIETMEILSAHGTSIKWQFRKNKPYRFALEKDKTILDYIDPLEKIPVNYDLFTGNLLKVLPEDFDKAVIENKRRISHKLSLDFSSDVEKEILTFIVFEVRSVYRNSKRPVVFEVPGTRGWSLFPSPWSLHAVSELISRFYPGAKLCLDIGHLLTWKTNEITITDIINIVRPIVKKIDMFHISSVGSATQEFREAYEMYYGKLFPLWHVEGLDLMLAVHEKDMIELLQKLRDMTDYVLEVCETRMPSMAIADYFAGYSLDFIDNTPYLSSLELQAKLLGYTS